ncbi:hypothetical protein [Serratia fonticola]|uniref:hypothetical protein n=1 Tax=Serratia fonticola TaxID=47917 RepID=UPI003AAF81BC
MSMKSEGNTITCDCGFSFQRGHSGKHECADGLRAKLAAAVRREEGMKAIVDVMGLRITELDQQLQQPAPTVSFYRDGIMAAAKWVDHLREAYDNEHGRHDPDTGSFEFGNSAQEEHSSTLQDIADGIRSLHPNAKNTAPAVPEDVATALEWIDDFIARCNGDDRGACNSVNVLRVAILNHVGGSNEKVQPVFFIEIEGDDWINAGRIPGSTFDFNNLPDGINLLYAAPPAPALPGELLDAMAEVIRISDRDHEAWSRAKAAISACRAAMLQPVSQGYTLNSPVIPDGWKLVPNEPTTKQRAAGHRAMEGGIDKVTLAYRAMVEVAPPTGGPDDSHATAT